MVGHQDRWQEDLFVAGPLRDLIPEEHILKRVDKVLDLSWLREEVKDTYSPDLGRPSIDPESAVRLMLAGFFQGIVQDRKLMREAQVNLAIRWFAGYRLHEKLPDHSNLTRIRQRWGAERFRRIFERTVKACRKAGLVDGETVHIDASLIRADVSWESLTREHVEQVLEENVVEEERSNEEPPKGRPGRPRTRPPQEKRVSTTDPDATMTTDNKKWRLEPSFKQHTAVDDRAGVIVDVAVTTGEASEGRQLLEQLARIEVTSGTTVKTVTADAGYAHSTNYQALEERQTDAVIPPQAHPRNAKRIPARRFKYDAKHQVARCPGGRTLSRKGRVAHRGGWRYRARACDCSTCPLRPRCLSKTAKTRTLVILDGYEALLRARRRHARGWDEPTREHYRRHRWRVEGIHGEAKTQHGLHRAVRRWLANVAIQVYLTAAVMNLKRLAGALAAFFWPVLLRAIRPTRFPMPLSRFLGAFTPDSRGTHPCYRPAHTTSVNPTSSTAPRYPYLG